MWHTKKRFPLSAHFPSLSLSNVWSPSSGDKWWHHAYTKINFKELLCHTAVTFVPCSVLHLLSCRHKMKHKQHWYEAQWTFHAFRLTAYIKLSLLLWCLPPCRLLSSVHLYELTFFVTPPLSLSYPPHPLSSAFFFFFFFLPCTRFSHSLMLGPSGMHPTGIPHPAIVPPTGKQDHEQYDRSMYV